MPWLVDTNVVCAGLISRDAGSPTRRIVDAMLAGRMGHAVSLPLVHEYEQVIRRPALRRQHGLDDPQIEQLVAALVRQAIRLQTAASVLAAPDPGDQFLWDALASHPGLQLVTGDKRLLQSPHWLGRIHTPAEWQVLARDA